MIAKDYYNVVT